MLLSSSINSYYLLIYFKNIFICFISFMFFLFVIFFLFQLLFGNSFNWHEVLY